MLTGSYTAVPVFLGIMLLIFWLTFDVIGAALLQDWLAVGIDAVTALVDRGLTAYGINPVVHSLVDRRHLRRRGQRADASCPSS